MKIYLSVLLLCLSAKLQAQLKGKVTDAETGQPLSAASIFIANSSAGIFSDKAGLFTLNYTLSNRVDIIVSCVGYETTVKKLAPESSSGLLQFKLHKRSAELENIRVRNYEKDGWQKWGKLFSESIIGADRSAAACKIKNSESIKFIYDKATETLTAFSSEPLIIENKYLGYILSYDLQSYKFDFITKVVTYTGFPLFKDIKASEKQNKLFSEHRQYVYEGSVMHFMRSFFSNALDTNGFEMHALYRYPNREKLRIKILYSSVYASDSMKLNIPADSAAYYDLIMNNTDSIDVAAPSKIRPDSISHITDKTSISVAFPGHIQIKYAKEKEVPAQSLYRIRYVKMKPVSVMSILKGPIEVYPDGSYAEPEDLLTEGFWSRNEKLSNLLPVDYQLPKSE